MSMRAYWQRHTNPPVFIIAGVLMLAKACEKVDPLAVLPIYQRLVVNNLGEVNAKQYRNAVRQLAKMRKLASGSAQAALVWPIV